MPESIKFIGSLPADISIAQIAGADVVPLITMHEERGPRIVC